MLTEKLWNNEVNLNVVKYMISESTKMYNTLFEKKNNNEIYESNLILQFISDDIYEFDCITKFSKIMIENGINIQMWKNIYDEIQKYNLCVNENEQIYNVMKLIVKNYSKKSDEYKFMDKIITSSYKSGITLKQTKFSETSNRIELIKNRLSDDYNNCPIISLTENELKGINLNILKKYYNEQTQLYDIPLNKQIYNLFQKLIDNSNVRKKIDDMIYDSYEKNIPRLTYLFIYKHVKANMLGYETYLDLITQHSKDTVKNTLESIIVSLGDRCNLELSIMSQLKKKCENDTILYTWDIPYYINKWKILYGIDEKTILQYFEINNTLTSILNIVSNMFSLKITKITNPKLSVLNNNDVVVYRIVKGNTIIGEVIFDLYNRQNKINGARTTCINTRCMYPFEKQRIQPVSIYVSMNIEKKDVTLITLDNLIILFNEIGKIIYYVSCEASYSLFGGMYSEPEIVDAFGKFVELLLFTNDTLKVISKNIHNSTQLTNEVLNKIIGHQKLEYGVTYKYQCLYSMYDLFVHSQTDFINECKTIMRIQNIDVQRSNILECMHEMYNSFYEAIFNVGKKSIYKESKHFHPVIWSYLFNGNENMNFLKILSDIYAHNLYNSFCSYKNKQEFCTNLSMFITNSTSNNSIQFSEFIKKQLSVNCMFEYFGLNNNDMSLSLYNINEKNIRTALYLSPEQNDVVNKKNIVKENIKKKSPEQHKQKNHFEMCSDNIKLSESDPEFKRLLSQVMH